MRISIAFGLALAAVLPVFGGDQLSIVAGSDELSVATSGDVRDQPKVADAASELLQDVFGKDKSPCRLVYGVASLPLGTPVELEIIFEVGEEGKSKN